VRIIFYCGQRRRVVFVRGGEPQHRIVVSTWPPVMWSSSRETSSSRLAASRSCRSSVVALYPRGVIHVTVIRLGCLRSRACPR